jgi:hypothetical protein
MSEAWFLELLGNVRDVARDHAMSRLAEHLDDAMLVAASEFHEARLVLETQAGHVEPRGEAARGFAATSLH